MPFSRLTSGLLFDFSRLIYLSPICAPWCRRYICSSSSPPPQDEYACDAGPAQRRYGRCLTRSGREDGEMGDEGWLCVVYRIICTTVNMRHYRFPSFADWVLPRFLLYGRGALSAAATVSPQQCRSPRHAMISSISNIYGGGSSLLACVSWIQSIGQCFSFKE